MFELPPLPYSPEALEPHIDRQTMETHHDKHHQGYVTKLNKALEGHAELQEKPISDLLENLEAVPEAARQAVRNNGGGHANHSLFWESMGPLAGAQPPAYLTVALDRDFGGMENFKRLFTETATGLFGSGWVWLSVHDSKLVVEPYPNQDSPLMAGKTPLLGLDVWEHAYYLKYQNRRADYVKAWWSLVNWSEVAQRYVSATS